MKKTQLQQLIREELNKINEEEYDFYRDYKAGTITKDEYDSLVKRFQASQRNFRGGQPRRAVQSIYLNIPFSKKDDLKSIYGKALRWDSDKKSWYYLTGSGQSLPDDLTPFKTK